ncbi:MAG: M81 family metallopeptidase [Shinella sp.]|uniref:M81 family metallopeptidase n=1 Tax=Shinella sp. TaxID=1870904 RepID=UPI003C71DA3D
MTSKRILLAALYHETHTFVEEVTQLADFTLLRGAEILGHRGDGSNIDGFLSVAEREKWELVPVCDFCALPSGTTDHAVFTSFCIEFEAGLRAALADGGLDGIWLALHGAMVTTQCEDPEGVLLALIRSVPGAEYLPVFGVFDLHACFTPLMAAHSNCLVGYRENPHTDTFESAVRSADLLARALKAPVLPRCFVRNIAVIWPPTGTATADRPMRDLEAMARALEAENPDFWCVNIIAGYSFADIFHAGVAVTVATTGPEAAAQQALDRLEALALALRDAGLPDEWLLDEALEQVKQDPQGPNLIVEPADNIGGGAPGDGTSVLRGFLRHGLANAAVAIADPAAVAALADAAPGEIRHLSIGGKGSRLDPGPLQLEVRFLSRSDGRFTLEDCQSHLAGMQGIHIDMGPSAVVEHQGIRILLNSRKTPPFDLGQFRSQGIIPEDLSVIGIKAAVAHRRAYDPIARRSFTVTTPGPCTSDLASLPYRRLRRPVYPVS